MKTKFVIIFACLYFFSCGSGKNDVSAEKVRVYATELYNKGLYAQAIEEYKNYLENEDASSGIKANINYTIGNIYFERLMDYQNALAYYLKIKHFYPESNLINEVNQKIIACLERMNRPSEAMQELRETTNIDKNQVQKNKPGEVVAEIGDRKITLGDLEFEMNRELERTPVELRPKDIGKEEKLAFLKQYLTIEILYGKAMRMGLDRDKEVIDGTFQAKKSLMTMKALQDEFKNKIKIDEKDLELYYQKNKEKFVEKDDKGKLKKQKSFEEVKEEVYKEVLAQKQRQVMDELLIQLMNAQDVKIFTDKVK